MKLLASMSLAALLSLSPAVAKQSPKPAPVATAPDKCGSPERWLKEIPIAPITTLTGDAVKDFVTEANAYTTATQGETTPMIPAGEYNEVIIWPRADGSAVFVMFVAGCSTGYGHLTLDFLKELAKPKSDGSI